MALCIKKGVVSPPCVIIMTDYIFEKRNPLVKWIKRTWTILSEEFCRCSGGCFSAPVSTTEFSNPSSCCFGVGSGEAQGVDSV